MTLPAVSASACDDASVSESGTETSYLDVQVFSTAGSDTGCETDDVQWSVSES